jgi:hypothetical protein
VDPVPNEIIDIYWDVTVAIDITFVNKVPFFITIARGLKFRTVEALSNRQVKTVKELLKKVINLYVKRVFGLSLSLPTTNFNHSDSGIQT